MTNSNGQWSKVSNGHCQYNGLLIPVIVGLTFSYWQLEDLWAQRVEEQGYSPNNQASVAQYFGRKVRADRLETNQLMMDFVWLTKLKSQLEILNQGRDGPL